MKEYEIGLKFVPVKKENVIQERAKEYQEFKKLTCDTYPLRNFM